MSERLPPVASTEDGPGESTSGRIVDAEVVDAEILEDPPLRSAAVVPQRLADQVSERPSAQRSPRSTFMVEAKPPRSDFLSWRSAMTGPASGPADRRLSWPRLLGFLAGALLFVALVSLIVLVAL